MPPQAPINQWIIYSVLGVPTVLFWAVVGYIAVKKDRTSRISHEAQTVQSEFRRGKDADEAKSSHKWTVFLIYFGIFYEFFALSSFAFYPVIPWPLPSDVLLYITYFRGQLRGLIAQIFFWLVLAVYGSGAMFIGRRTKFMKTIFHCCGWPKRFIVRTKQKYTVTSVYENPPLSPISGDEESPHGRGSPVGGERSGSLSGSLATPTSAEGDQGGTFAVQIDALTLDDEKKPKKRKVNITGFLDSHLKAILLHLGFIPACTAIFRMASCKYDPLGVAPAYLNGDANFACWDPLNNPVHLVYIVLGLPVVYLLYPFALYRSLHINDEDPELRFLPRFQVYLVMFEFIQVYSTTVMISFPQAIAPISATALMGLSAYNWYMQPALGAAVVFNHYRTGMLAAASWSSVVSIAVVYVNNRTQVWPLLLYVILILPIFFAGYFASKWRAKKMEQNALEGLTKVKEGEGKEDLRIAETVANLALVEGYRVKLMTTQSLDALMKLIGREDNMVKCQALRAVANLSAEEVNREGILLHSIIQPLMESLKSDYGLAIHHAARAVFHLSSVKTDRRMVMLDGGITGILMGVLDRREMMVEQEHALYMALTALMNVSTIAEMKTHFFDRDGFNIGPILDIVSSTSYDEQTRKNAMGILYNLSVLPDNRDAMVYQGVLEKLNAVMKKCPQSVHDLAQKTVKIITMKNRT